jgi:hypothetical protein
MTKYKSETYKGYKVRFIKLNTGKFGVAAQPVRRGHTQYLGMGRTKTEAFNDYKDSVDRIDKAGNW